jgi:ribosomal protein S18 acetylase RimI-like enzyme
MEKENKIVYVEQPGEDEWGTVGGGIRTFNIEQTGIDSSQSLCFVIQSPEGDILGGVIGSTYYEWLHVDLMWIKEEFRGRGYGSRLLKTAEDEARKRGVKNAYLDTFNFQAPDFYKKYGYRVFGELENFPQGYTRYFMRKEF